MSARICASILILTTMSGCASARDATAVDRPFFFQSIPPDAQTPHNPKTWLTYPEAADIPPTAPAHVASATPAVAQSQVSNGPIGLSASGAGTPFAPAPIDSAPVSLQPALPVSTAADLQLVDWVVRGVRRPADGPAHAFVISSTPGSVPREVVENQSYPEFGVIKEISRSSDGIWIVRTEIGWISQANTEKSP